MVYFPIAKLGMLFLRQIAKPINQIIKRTATNNHTFRALVISPLAQMYHWIGVRAKMRMLGINQPKFVPPLSKAMTIETGSNLLGELVLLSLGISVILLEFARQQCNEKKKHATHKFERANLENEIVELNARIAYQIEQIETIKLKLRSFPDQQT